MEAVVIVMMIISALSMGLLIYMCTHQLSSSSPYKSIYFASILLCSLMIGALLVFHSTDFHSLLHEIITLHSINSTSRSLQSDYGHESVIDYQRFHYDANLYEGNNVSLESSLDCP